MSIFYSIQAFRLALKKLCAKPRDGYSSIKEDICDSFKDKNIDEIRINRDMVLNEDNFTIIKLRVPNSGQHLSKRDGFRLIYLVHKQKEEIILLSIYPKRGAQGLITISDASIVSLLEEYVQEEQSSSLISHQIENNLEEEINDDLPNGEIECTPPL